MTPLYLELNRWRVTPWAWGRMDCMTALSDWAVVCGWPDPAVDVRLTYHDASSCQRATGFLRDPLGITSHCFEGVAGLPVVETAREGDIALLNLGQYEHVGAVWTDAYGWAANGEGGVSFFQPAAVPAVPRIWGWDMQLRGLAATLLAIAALAEPAQAGPAAALVVAIGGAWAGTAAAAALGGAAVLGAIGVAAVQIGVAAVIGMVAAKIMAPRVPTPETQQTNIAQPVTYMDRVYGRVRKGGPYGLIHFTQVQLPAYRNVDCYVYTVIVAAHRIHGYVEHYLDDRHVEIGKLFPGDDGTYVTSEPYGWFKAVTIKGHLGLANQPADKLLVDEVAGWTAQHDMARLAYGRITARQHRDGGPRAYPTGRIPVWTPVIDGNATILDPRTGARGYSRNAALCFAHELVEYQGLAVDWDAVAVEADVCDQLVTTGEGTQRPRWRVGGVIGDDMDFSSIRGAFATAANMFIFERTDGKFGFYVGRWMEPKVSLGAADFLALQIGMARDIDTANEYTVRYVEPENAWKESPSGAWVHDPAGPRTRKELQAFMVGDHHQAVAIAKRAARSDHAMFRISGTLTFAGFDLIGERFVSFNHPEMGITCVLEVQKLTLNSDRMSWAFEGVSTKADDWLVQPNEAPDRPEYDRNEGGSDIAVIGSLTVQAGRSSSGAAVQVVTFTEQAGNYRQQLRYAVAGTEAWQLIDVPSGSLRHEQAGLVDGETYEWQARNIRSGEEGPWSPPINVVAVANSTRPPALSQFAASGGAQQARVTFVTPNSPNYTATRIFRARNSTNFSEAQTVQTVYGSPNVSDGWTDAGLSAANYTYWATPINASGLGGPPSGPLTVQVV